MTATTEASRRTPATVERLGAHVPYADGLAWQQHAADRLRRGGLETLALLEHAPVYTLGMRADEAHVLASPAWLAARGADLVRTDRGGDVTFHGPGQLVAYPILDLRARGLGPATYVRLLEECAIATAAACGVTAERVPGHPGIWTQNQKLAAIGVRIRDGVSTHGLALNVTTDLAWFEAIVPCGIADAGVTSLARELGPACPSFEDVVSMFLDAFERVFAVDLIAAQAVC